MESTHQKTDQTVTVNDETWHKFGLNYIDDAGKTFSVHIHARDFDDAQRRIDAIIRTAMLDGQILKEIPAS